MLAVQWQLRSQRQRVGEIIGGEQQDADGAGWKGRGRAERWCRGLRSWPTRARGMSCPAGVVWWNQRGAGPSVGHRGIYWAVNTNRSILRRTVLPDFYKKTKGYLPVQDSMGEGGWRLFSLCVTRACGVPPYRHSGKLGGHTLEKLYRANDEWKNLDSLYATFYRYISEEKLALWMSHCTIPALSHNYRIELHSPEIIFRKSFLRQPDWHWALGVKICLAENFRMNAVSQLEM